MSISVTRPHPFSKVTARARLEHLADSLRSELKVHYKWEGDKLTFKRIGAKGFIEVTEDVIHVDVHTSRVLPVSETWLREQINALLDTHFQAENR